jgi:CheY-like chemotaxis protein
MRQKRVSLVSSVPGWSDARRAEEAGREHRVAVMAKPVLVVVDGEGASLEALTAELESRYGVYYQVVSGSSAEVGLARLAELKAAGADVPLVLADERMPGMGGTRLLARTRDIFPTARRGLLISWSDRSAPAPFLEAAARGWVGGWIFTWLSRGRHRMSSSTAWSPGRWRSGGASGVRGARRSR